MNPEWTISGEEGKTLGAAARPVGVVGLQGALLTLQSLEVDTLTWVQTAGIVPDDLQVISLYRDGIREFHGTITDRKYVYQAGSGSGYSITASGALYRMSLAQISESSTDGTGESATRTTFSFPPGDLEAMVRRLLVAAPGIAVGDIDPMFNCGRRNFSGGTWLSVLIDLLKPVADVASWVDYAGGGIPRLCIGRRPGMQTLRIQIGVDPVGRVELAPRSELKVTGFTLAGAARDAAGRLVYSSQAAGDGSQIVSVSGPEIGAFVPPDNLPMVTIQTQALEDMTWAQLLALDPGITDAIAAGTFLYTGIGYAGGSYGIPACGFNYPAARHRITTGQVLDFLKVDYGLVTASTRLRGWIGFYYDGGTGYGSYVTELKSRGLAVSYADASTHVFAVLVDATIETINLSWPAATDVYAKAAYEYLTPPVGMAEGMLAAAGFVPYQGSVVLNPGFPLQRFLGRRLNVLNGDPGLAHAGAIVQAATITLATGAVLLRCGAPSRVPLNSLIARYSPSSKDNIELA